MLLNWHSAKNEVISMPNGFILPDLKHPPVPLKTINYQNRLTVNASIYPWSSIGILRVCNDSGCGYGTGFLFADDIFITARHNFTTSVNFNSAAIWFGNEISNSGSEPFAIYPPVFHQQLDLAVMLVQNCSLQPLSIFNGILPKNVIVCGFGDYSISHSLSFSEGNILENGGGILKYSANTDHGDSGAPVFTKNPDNTYSVIAVHTNAGVGNWNEGILLSQDVYVEIETLASQLRVHYKEN